ncbi:MAG: RHS repeat-associated core domain-containing protein [Desulfobacteraceae bacterium]|nr:RHS repeat-associated core domain-containing protein [Desulfobacteraceae bacterium]
MKVLTKPVSSDSAADTADHGFGFNKARLNDRYSTPQSGDYIYDYDRDGRLTKKTFPSGQEIVYVYETGKDRTDYISTPEGNIEYDYSCGNRPNSVTKGSESVSYGYDGDIVTDETLTGTVNHTLSYGYDNEFSLKSFTYAGRTETYTYYDDGLLTGISGSDGDSASVTRNPDNGLPESLTFNDMTVSRDFNGYGEQDQGAYTVGGIPVFEWKVTQRDDSGRIKEKQETVGSVTVTYTYDYDVTGRLEKVYKDGVPAEDYGYDPKNGIRISETNAERGISGKSYSYSDEDHLLTAGNATYRHDPDGFLKKKTDASGETLYDYSSRGELLSVTLPDDTFIEYSHDPFGRRIEKKINSAVVEKYLWQGRTRLLAVYDKDDTLIMRFEYADARMPVSMTANDSSVYYLTYDQVGSLRVVTDVSGKAVKKLDYDSFGNVYYDSDPAFEIPFGFAGGLHDRDTGLVRFGYRDYDPNVGRWTAKDPIGFAGGDTDLYGYCINYTELQESAGLPVHFLNQNGSILSSYFSFFIADPTADKSKKVKTVGGGT